MADGEPYAVPATIEEPGVLEDIERALSGAGSGATRG
jgi:hypothetical protein